MEPNNHNGATFVNAFVKSRHPLFLSHSHGPFVVKDALIMLILKVHIVIVMWYLD